MSFDRTERRCDVLNIFHGLLRQNMGRFIVVTKYGSETLNARTKVYHINAALRNNIILDILLWNCEYMAVLDFDKSRVCIDLVHFTTTSDSYCVQ